MNENELLKKAIEEALEEVRKTKPNTPEGKAAVERALRLYSMETGRKKIIYDSGTKVVQTISVPVGACIALGAFWWLMQDDNCPIFFRDFGKMIMNIYKLPLKS